MSKKENLQEPEELQNVENALSSSEEFIENHLKEIIYAVIAIVAVFVGFFLFKYKYLQPRELKAQEQIYKGEEYFAQDSFALAINGDGVDFIGFENIAKEYKWTKTAKLAKVYAGISYYRMHQPEKAIELLKGFNADDKMVSPAVTGLVGDCYVAVKDYDNAAKYFEKAVKNADNELISPIYLEKLAVIYEVTGKKDKAIEAYTTIKEKYPNSMSAYDIDRHISRVKASK
ncbi:MAG: tetratricopeptide repeat protein [Bacteroidales bacterium]|jgi:tetratricopeptide (TPR) repeat protein|nr:tetratricopeptide repeat protein [Bacteroidales bacterium]MBP5135058.1 tetratricopeptide repeat protein [Paludibacteraceae bacterium]MBR6309676.1 tetratricopeptide repeat protein [Paludibacteraceae bacterium]MDD6357342.1 tetratricopeptide repeat protein [Bacteroidales bacterium]